MTWIRGVVEKMEKVRLNWDVLIKGVVAELEPEVDVLGFL